LRYNTLLHGVFDLLTTLSRYTKPLETETFHYDNGAKYEGEWKYTEAPDQQETEPKIRVRHGTGKPKSFQ